MGQAQAAIPSLATAITGEVSAKENAKAARSGGAKSVKVFKWTRESLKEHLLSHKVKQVETWPEDKLEA